jgi:hypothetical protein
MWAPENPQQWGEVLRDGVSRGWLEFLTLVWPAKNLAERVGTPLARSDNDGRPS